MSTGYSKDQICLRVTPPVYRAVTEITTRFKNMGIRGWTNSALINVIIEENKQKYLEMSHQEMADLFESYKVLRDTPAKE